MKRILTIIILIFPICAFGQVETQDTCICNINVIRELRQDIDNLTTEKITNFLRSYQSTCKDNAEFSQAANWNLFYILKENTQLTINALENSKNDATIDFNWIIQQFKMPVNDAIDIISIYKNVREIHPRTETVESILNNLESAANGMNLEIKK